MTAGRYVLPLLSLLLLSALSAQAATWTTIDVPGATWTYATGINATGDIVGYYLAEGTGHGFLLKSGTIVTLDVPGALNTGASSINDAGQIVGSFQSADGQDHGFVFDGVNYTTLDFPGVSYTSAVGINNAEQIVGYYDDNKGHRHGFLWSNGSFVAIDVPGFRFTQLAGINNRGFIVAASRKKGVYRSFIRNPEGDFHNFGSVLQMTSINDHKVIVGHDLAANEGFKFNLRTNRFADLQYPGERFTSCAGVNNGGQIVGEYYDDKTNYHAFLRTP